METLRAEVLEFIAIAHAELRGLAQPRDLAELRELEVDAEDAQSEEQLQAIAKHARNLRLFCENRKMSGQVSAPRRSL